MDLMGTLKILVPLKTSTFRILVQLREFHFFYFNKKWRNGWGGDEKTGSKNHLSREYFNEKKVKEKRLTNYRSLKTKRNLLKSLM